MLCFISIPSLGVKIHIRGNNFGTILVTLNKVKKAHPLQNRFVS
jgi:hypothetical protein